jgi:hypothetical protein
MTHLSVIDAKLPGAVYPPGKLPSERQLRQTVDESMRARPAIHRDSTLGAPLD